MFGVFDAGVNALHREVIGPVALDAALVPGQWRELTAEEVNALRAAAKPKKLNFILLSAHKHNPAPCASCTGPGLFLIKKNRE